MSGTHVVLGQWQQWATSAQSLVLAVFGAQSPHYKNFTHTYSHCRGADESLNSLKAIFSSAKENYEGGYVFEVDLRVSGEVFADFVVLARTALVEGNKDVAAVLACATRSEFRDACRMIKDFGSGSQ
jgi:hypothetical protein